MTTQKIWLLLGKPLILVLACLFLSSCETGYLIKNSYYQLRLLQKREPIESLLQQEKL